VQERNKGDDGVKGTLKDFERASKK